MQGSMEQFVLMESAMSTEVIADGQHLSPELLEFAYRMLGPDRLCLVTDANRAMDMPPGQYRFGPIEDGVWFESDGKVGFVSRDALASSVVGMDTMVRNMFKNTSASLPEAVRMGSLTQHGAWAWIPRSGVWKRANKRIFSFWMRISRCVRFSSRAKRYRQTDHNSSGRQPRRLEATLLGTFMTEHPRGCL